MAKIQEVNLALGGGGAKGFVHLGVIEELTSRGIEIKAIVGTSIGAIIGSLFAYFVTTLFRDRPTRQQDAAEAVSEIFLTTSFWQYADLNVLSALRRGLFRGEKVSDWLSKLLYNQELLRPIRFCELEFPLTITVTDAHTGKCLVLNKNEEPQMFLHDAVRASMSIQWVFKEIEIEIKKQPTLCWDGGTTGNCRFDLAYLLYPGRPTIASSLTYRGSVASTQTGILGAWMRPFKVLNHTTAILMRAVEEGLREALANTTVEGQEIIFIEPLLSYGGSMVGTYDFHLDRTKREILIENGRNAVSKALDSRCY